jgi:hypothetical protein
MKNVDNFTIFIKNDIHFKKFSLKSRNILPNITNKYISSCKQNTSDPYCPVIQVKELMEKAEPNPSERALMLMKVFFLFYFSLNI